MARAIRPVRAAISCEIRRAFFSICPLKLTSRLKPNRCYNRRAGYFGGFPPNIFKLITLSFVNMPLHTQALQDLIDALTLLPGIGRKSATRLAFFIVRQPADTAKKISNAITNARNNIKFCEVCQNLCENSPCERCSQPVRDETLLCVVESPQDLVAIESTHEFYGRFHVLHGVISPLDGITPADLKIRELISRLSQQKFSEIILATNPSVEGEATAAYLKRLIEPLGIKITRIASGLPMGAQLEFADKATLGRSLIDRRPI